MRKRNHIIPLHLNKKELGIGAGNLFRFLRMDNGEAMLSAQLVGNLPYLCDVGFLVAAVFPAVFHGHGIPDNVVMDAFGVEMGADHRLKVPAEQSIRKFQPDLVGQFRGNLPGGKALHQMEALHAFFLVPHFLDAAHILKSRFTGAAESGREQILLGFVFVEGVWGASQDAFGYPNAMLAKPVTGWKRKNAADLEAAVLIRFFDFGKAVKGGADEISL